MSTLPFQPGQKQISASRASDVARPHSNYAVDGRNKKRPIQSDVFGAISGIRSDVWSTLGLLSGFLFRQQIAAVPSLNQPKADHIGQ